MADSRLKARRRPPRVGGGVQGLRPTHPDLYPPSLCNVILGSPAPPSSWAGPNRRTTQKTPAQNALAMVRNNAPFHGRSPSPKDGVTALQPVRPPPPPRGNSTHNGRCMRRHLQRCQTAGLEPEFPAKVWLHLVHSRRPPAPILACLMGGACVCRWQWHGRALSPDCVALQPCASVVWGGIPHGHPPEAGPAFGIPPPNAPRRPPTRHNSGGPHGPQGPPP